MVLLTIKKQKVPIISATCIILLVLVLLSTFRRGYRSADDKAISLQRHAHKVKGCYVILIRNSELDGIVSTMTQIEDTFNSKFDYPYVFLNDEPFTEKFQSTVSSLTEARVLFGALNSTMWGYPDFIDQEYAATCRQNMAEAGIPYASSESYRHMCRFQSGFFFRHPLLDEFDYYWRLEPYVDYYCQLDYDVFRFMKDNKKKYGFTIAYKEHIETVPTLWDTVMNFLKEYPDIAKQLPSRNESLIDFVTNDGGRSYNTCHFWSNFEIGDLSLWRSEAYLKLFHYLDRSGGFYYERWGDAPVHSIAASLLLKKNEFHFFNDVGYRHTSYTHCPVDDAFRQKCSCEPSINFDFNMNLSCYPNYKAALDPAYKKIFETMMHEAQNQTISEDSKS